mgnify:CR=1 FL=1
MIDRFIYTAMTGVKHSMGQLANTTHNLANAQTPGFREMLQMYRSVPIKGAYSDSRAFVIDSTVGSNFEPGTYTKTDNPLDLSIDGPGFFSVRRPDGQEVYTRAGNFTVDSDHFLVAPNGYKVMGIDDYGIEIPEQAGSITVDRNGLISAVGGTSDSQVVLGQLKLVNVEGFELNRGQDGFFEWNGGELQADENVRVAQGSLEGSNVNVAQGMIELISQTRMFDLNMKLVQSAEENAKSATSLISLQRS